MAEVADPVWSDDYMAQMNLVYILNDHEQYYSSLLRHDAREPFSSYLVGVKLRQFDDLGWREWYRIPFPELMPAFNEWVAGGPATGIVNGHIAFGRARPDPRLDPENYVLGTVLSRYYETLAPFENDDFRQYVIGRKVASDRPGDDVTFEGEILNDWILRNRDDIERHHTIGREWDERYHPAPPPENPAGTDHFYVAGANPASSATDVGHVNREPGLAGYEGTWRFEKTVYQNKHITRGQQHYRRIVHLFARVDEFGTIRDRMAVKIQGHDSLAEITRYVFGEYDCQRLLNLAGSAHILEARARSSRHRLYRHPQYLGYIYLDWAPFGSLWNLVHPKAPYTRQFPEPFLWLIFRGLAEALHVQHTGRAVLHDDPRVEDSTVLNNDLLKNPGWQSMVNTDIKLANVVLGHAQHDFYPAYKTAQLIDFGLVVDEGRYGTRDSKKDRPGKHGKYMQIGTRGSRPPEQFHPPHNSQAARPISLLSDTWNVGKIMFELMEQRYIDVDSSHFEFEHPDTYTHMYSHALESLVAQCVKFDQKHRPGVNALLYKTRMGLRNWENAYGDVGGEDVGRWGWEWKKEYFRMGDTVPRHWGWRRGVVDGGDEDDQGGDGGDDDNIGNRDDDADGDGPQDGRGDDDDDDDDNGSANDHEHPAKEPSPEEPHKENHNANTGTLTSAAIRFIMRICNARRKAAKRAHTEVQNPLEEDEEGMGPSSTVAEPGEMDQDSESVPQGRTRKRASDEAHGRGDGGGKRRKSGE